MKNLFTGIKVIDCSRVFSGPFATRYFSDYGADVIKIETENYADESRKFSPLLDGKSLYFEILNRGKKSINLNLKNTDDTTLFFELIQEADIFVENFSPDIKNKLGIDYATLSKINPRLIYGSLNGYGEKVNKKAYDTIIQAESGFSSLSGEHTPLKNATSVIDSFSGLSLALGLTSLLYQREKTGKGDFVNIPMIASGIQLLEQNLTDSSLTGKDPALVGNGDSAIFPFGFFKAQDGNISLAIGNDNLWEKFSVSFLPDLVLDYCSNTERLDNKEYLTACIESAFSTYGVIELSEKLMELGIPNSQIKTMTDILNTGEYYDEKYIKKCTNSHGDTYVVPYEFIKYKNYPIEDIVPAPFISKRK